MDVEPTALVVPIGESEPEGEVTVSLHDTAAKSIRERDKIRIAIYLLPELVGRDEIFNR
jgi:hypothetical protein